MKTTALSLILLGTTFLGFSMAVGAADPKIVTYAAGQDVPVSVTLLKRDGNVGRGSPFMTNYRPQLRFSVGKEEATCAIAMLKPKEMVEPGETAEATINCTSSFRSIEGKPGFTGYEGGRRVIEGTLLQ